MTKQEASRTIEAILYVSGEPVPVSDLSERLLMTMSEALDALDALQERLEEPESGIQLNRSGGSVYLSIKPACAPDVEKYLQPAKKQPLSQAVMETLSIVAYRQPVTKGEIEQVRGVKCDYSVQALLRGGFIEEVGVRDTLGHPIEYRTTDRFLSHLGISSLDELPPMRDEGDDVEV